MAPSNSLSRGHHRSSSRTRNKKKQKRGGGVGDRGAAVIVASRRRVTCCGVCGWYCFLRIGFFIFIFVFLLVSLYHQLLDHCSGCPLQCSCQLHYWRNYRFPWVMVALFLHGRQRVHSANWLRWGQRPQFVNCCLTSCRYGVVVAVTRARYLQDSTVHSLVLVLNPPLFFQLFSLPLLLLLFLVMVMLRVVLFSVSLHFQVSLLVNYHFCFFVFFRFSLYCLLLLFFVSPSSSLTFSNAPTPVQECLVEY
ncbi:hypothetical protein TCDM_13014 [Trypanosoma cruzi Dm28c]|uniref:Uncharacterized protein n=1 Tax=Trypanosoma cruzi Dm28c TaxID=1416333 RepID=V5ATR6_TRYCR|nr:hypothetical protein TCDM_13014 [Trypanosoma cruzi Dm28c]